MARLGFIFMAGFFLILFVEYIGFFKGINNYFYDLSFRLRGVRDYNSDIIIVTIDEKTLSKLGRWPISRSYYADLLNFLGKARAVGLDIILSEPSRDDPALGMAIKRHGRVVLPAYVDTVILTSPTLQRPFLPPESGIFTLSRASTVL